MGFVFGNKIKVVLNAPLQDPIEYEIIGYKISLRREEANLVDVISEREAQEAAAATAAAAQAAIAEEPTAQFAPPQQESNPELDRVRRYANKGILLDDEQDDDEDGTRMFDAEEASGELDYDGDYDEDDEDEYDRPRRRGRYADDSEESEDDVMAERIIRWAPPITAVICALIIAVAVIYRFLIA